MPYNMIIAKDINIPFVSDHAIYTLLRYGLRIQITFKQAWLVSLFFCLSVEFLKGIYCSTKLPLNTGSVLTHDDNLSFILTSQDFTKLGFE